VFVAGIALLASFVPTGSAQAMMNTGGSGGGASCKTCKKVLMGKSCTDATKDGQKLCKDVYYGGGVVGCKLSGGGCSGPGAIGSGGGIFLP